MSDAGPPPVPPRTPGRPDGLGDPELLQDGLGARRMLPEGRPLPPVARAALGGAAVLALVLGTLVVAQHHAPAHRPPTAAAPTPAVTARPPVGAAQPRPVRDVQLLLDWYGYGIESDGFSLHVDLVNYGTEAVDVLATRLARAASDTGGDSTGGAALARRTPVTLLPDQSRVVSVPVKVSCPGSLSTPLPDRLDVTLDAVSAHADSVHRIDGDDVVTLPLAPLGNLLDEARHAYCRVPSAAAALYPTAVAGSVHAGPSQVDGSRWVTTTLRLENLTALTARVQVDSGDPFGVEVAPSGARVTVRPRATVDLPIRWLVQDCNAARSIRWPSLTLTVSIPTSTATSTYGFDDGFGGGWRQALAQVCPSS